MDLKDKLNLAWKYLLLAVIVIALFTIGRRHGGCRDHGQQGHAWKQGKGYCYMAGSHTGMDMMSAIKVEKMITNGDTTLVVWVNGEKVDDPEAFLLKHGDDSKHSKMMWKSRDGKRKIKKIHIEVEDDD